MAEFIILVVSGILGGLLAGLLGIGGGIVFLLILSFALPNIGVPPEELVQYKIANSIVGVFFATLSANLSLIKLKQFYGKQVLIVACGSVLFSLLALHFVVNTLWFTVEKFNIIIIILLMYMLFRVIRQVSRNTSEVDRRLISKKKYFFSGAMGGFIASLSGLGGGVIMVPIFYTVFKLNYNIAKSISIGVITITAFFMTIKNLLSTPENVFSEYHIGYVIPQISLILSLGVIIGGNLGVSLGQKISSRTTTVIYSLFLLVFITKKAFELFS
jgi:uncharacterized membrane protein YfcA